MNTVFWQHDSMSSQTGGAQAETPCIFIFTGLKYALYELTAL